MAPRYEISWSEEAKAELRRIPSFYRQSIVVAVDALAFVAEQQTRNRKRLRPIPELRTKYPDPAWEIRVGAFRVVYHVDEQTVRILGVKLKGSRTTGESL